MTINNLVENLLFLVVTHLPRAFAKASLAGDFDGHRPAVSRQAAYLFGFSRPVGSLHHRLSDELCGFPMRLGLNGTAAKTFVDVLLAVGSVVRLEGSLFALEFNLPLHDQGITIVR